MSKSTSKLSQNEASKFSRQSRLVFERMESKILLSADALGGVLPSDPFDQNEPALDLQQSVSLLESTLFNDLDSVSLDALEIGRAHV